MSHIVSLKAIDSTCISPSTMSSYNSWQLTNIGHPAEHAYDNLESDNEQPEYPKSTFGFASTDSILNPKGYTHVPPSTFRPSNHLTQPDQALSLTTRRNIFITVSTILWPVLILLLYVFIVFHYLLRDEVNGIVVEHIIDAKVVFYAWLVLSIFILEWLKASLAWFEAAVILNYPSWAPSNEPQLMWHLDRGWASFSVWCRVASSAYRHLVKRRTASWQGPASLWWYLAGTYLLFSVAVPLSGLSVDQRVGLQLGSRPVTILGVNETTFDVRTNAAVSGLASNNWRSGQVTTPSSSAVFYAPEGTNNVSGTFFEDFAQDIYQQDLAGIKSSTQNRTVKVFSGPPVSERSHGRAWGFLSTVSCSALNLQDGMKLINATGPSNWTSPFGNSEFFEADYVGLTPVFASADSSFGIDATYVVASDRDISWVGNGDYVNSTTSNITTQPIQGALEIAIWQSIPDGFKADDGFKNMTSNPLVTALNDSSVLGYGVRCTVESDVGYANLDAAKRTYSDFLRRPADSGTKDLTTLGSAIPIFQWPGVFAIQSIVFQVLSTVSLGYLGPPSCGAGSDTTCSAFYGANLATGGVPRISQVGDSQFAKALQIPSITPERMTLAMYKLFGETASAMMAIGPGNWTSADLEGLDPANDLIMGVVPWQLVLVLLSLWTVLSTLPQLLMFSQARWSQTLEAYAIKRFGPNWRDAT
ncbi:hypothetical protein GGR55DRAFT_653734 [Xylaria sp. FL0064]|nr:hypothetical protein GGR55DRAFT_653734 [Xylaria sp. FL0064]